MKQLRTLWLAIALAGSIICYGFTLQAGESILSRTIIGFYDSKVAGSPRYSNVHDYLEMPLNHLGFRVQYQDVQAELPTDLRHIHGAVLWFTPDTQIEKGDEWLDWLDTMRAQKKKLLIIGGVGLADKILETQAYQERVNKILHYIGVHSNFLWRSVLFDYSIAKATRGLVNFERKYSGVLPAFDNTVVWPAEGGETHLRIRTPQYESPDYSDLVITGNNGGYIADEYAVYIQSNEDGERLLNSWYVNPFRFLRNVFDGGNIPKPDTTTLNGNRIFYSHLDGDGWNNLSELEQHKEKRVLAADNLYEYVFSKYRDFPYTIGLIVSELRKDCYGIPESLEVAKKILALPNTEAGSHTYSHPLFWRFFATPDAVEREKEFDDLYPSSLSGRFFINEWLLGKDETVKQSYKTELTQQYEAPLRGIYNPNIDFEEDLRHYTTPRSYACEPFSLDREIRGSLDYIGNIYPNKPVKIYQWSGDTTPFEAAIRETRKQGVYNINGGDSRLDSEYPSYASVSPISVPVGKERQIYSSNSNENTYTNLWTGRFFGFKFLQSTVDNTESPIRIDPFNVYFHAYSGQKLASLRALQHNFDYARTRDLTPIFTSEFAAIANSYFGVEFMPLGKQGWRVLNRGELNTIRFDKATNLTLDFNRSKGVLGQRYYQGALYVALDPSVSEPELWLKNHLKFGSYPQADRPYLVKSNWKINDLHFGKKSLTFITQGLSRFKSVFKMPQSGEYLIRINNNKEKLMDWKLSTGDDDFLKVEFATDLPEAVSVTIEGL